MSQISSVGQSLYEERYCGRGETETRIKEQPRCLFADRTSCATMRVMHLDDAVGRILAAVEKQGRREDTLVVFTSNNGISTVENNDLKYPDDNYPNGKLIGNNHPLRGQQGDLHEGGIRVPTLVSWPGPCAHNSRRSPRRTTMPWPMTETGNEKRARQS